MLQSPDNKFVFSQKNLASNPMIQNRRPYSFLRGGLSLAVIASILSGCSLAPGMYFGNREPDQNANQATTTVQPVFKKITAQLIQEERTAQSQEQKDDFEKLSAKYESYKIGSGDYLAITVWDHPELTLPLGNSMAVPSSSSGGTTSASITMSSAMSTLGAGYPVSSDGKIQFPYTGDLKVIGLTESQARELLTKQLAKYIKDPQVTLRIASYRSQHIFVEGEIKSPGQVTIDDIAPSLPEALSRAGGITALGDSSRIRVTREDKNYWVDMPRLARDGINPNQILLRSNDMVRVTPREENKVYVLGEVNKPGSILMVNGRMTLNSALGEAGGLNSASADGNQVYVIRNANDEHPLVYHLDAHSPVMFALADNFELKARDVVYVDTSGIVRFNRVIGLILPTSQEITIINRGFK